MADPIDEKYHNLMNVVAHTLDNLFNGHGAERPKIVFALLLAEAGNTAGGRVNFISNGERSDMLNMMKEFSARAEGRYVEPEDNTAQ